MRSGAVFARGVSHGRQTGFSRSNLAGCMEAGGGQGLAVT